MKLGELYNKGKLIYSFEVFPPKTDEGIEKLITELKTLEKFKPAFVSVTYGAGGSTQGRSTKLIKRIHDECNAPPVPHFTCIGMEQAGILDFTKFIEGLGLHNILALRGDTPKDKAKDAPKNNAFHFANELVSFIKEQTSLHVAVAGYPEVHPEAASAEEDLKHLKMKVDAGAEIVITQLFYENKHYLDFVEKARKIGIKAPIIPGILPTTSKAQLEKIVDLSNAYVPEELRAGLNTDDSEKAKEFGINYAIKQIKELIASGVPGIHLYTLNHAEACARVLTSIK